MEDNELEVLCDNIICDERGDRPRCYLSHGVARYQNCVKYEYWRAFKDRHDRLNRKVYKG